MEQGTIEVLKPKWSIPNLIRLLIDWNFLIFFKFYSCKGVGV